MSGNYREYTTLTDFKSAKMPGSTGTSDDDLILDYIREVSKDIDDLAGWAFAPIVATHLFDAERDVAENGLLLKVDPWDLLAVTSITNGDGVAVAPTSYVFRTAGVTPYWGIKLKSSKGLSWTYADDPEDAITVVGIWGCHDDYANVWQTLATLGAALNASATTLTLSAAAGNAGELWKIGDEFLYLSARSGTAATIVRGVNGSTAAAHDNGATIYRWIPMREVSGMCRAGTAMKYALRENPQVETLIIDGRTLSVAKDVTQWLREQIRDLGLGRV